ncbi:MAG TPA: stage 0 sporulation family protein [Bacilli bacterium]
MAKVVGIGFKEIGKIYWFNPESYNLKVNDLVVVETIRGIELARVVEGIKEVDDSEIEHDLKPVIRIATKKDVETFYANQTKAKNAIPKIKEIIEKHKLEMKTIDCEYTLDATKLLIYYTADGRVDFRELVKDLASEFRVRIELRQIGQRESAKMVGGIGPCGRMICCKNHLREFDLVTMKAAKEQGMALSAGKIAGLCGKLMCCINYENDYYSEIKEKLPAVGDCVQTPTCPCCKVISVDYLRQLVRTETGEEDGYEEWPATKVTKIVNNETDNGTNS